MDTNVFINGREACSKAADGFTAPAFPDPCWSPPPPPAGPVVLPYPNTARARDLSHGTQTVFIMNKPVAVKDMSFLHNSIGNATATPAFQKGVATQELRGKSYFVDWSPNVKFEGLNVCRHLDPTTHNHR